MLKTGSAYAADSNAAFAFLATDAFLRVYAIGNVARAKRSVVKKIRMDGTCLFASTFHVNQAPGAVALVQRASGLRLQVSPARQAAFVCRSLLPTHLP